MAYPTSPPRSFADDGGHNLFLRVAYETPRDWARAVAPGKSERCLVLWLPAGVRTVCNWLCSRATSSVRISSILWTIQLRTLCHSRASDVDSRTSRRLPG